MYSNMLNHILSKSLIMRIPKTPTKMRGSMERLYCLLVSDFLLLCQLFVIPCAFIIILDAVDKLLCINTIISQENFIVTRALNIILDAVDIISRMHTVI